MNKHYHDIFYDAYNFPLEKKKEILNWCKERCFNWRVDKLDCSESWSSQKVEMPYEEIMNKLDNTSHFVVIHRRGFENMQDNPRKYMGEWCLETGFRTSGIGVDYFLWIYCEEKHVEEIAKEFNLKLL